MIGDLSTHTQNPWFFVGGLPNPHPHGPRLDFSEIRRGKLPLLGTFAAEGLQEWFIPGSFMAAVPLQ